MIVEILFCAFLLSTIKYLFWGFSEKCMKNVSVFRTSEAAIRRCSLGKRRSENVQQIYRRTPMSKCDFKSHFAMVFSCKFAEHLFLITPLEDCFCIFNVYCVQTRKGLYLFRKQFKVSKFKFSKFSIDLINTQKSK